jgi:hypothetical protein
VATLLPELDDGAEPELSPLELESELLLLVEPEVELLSPDVELLVPEPDLLAPVPDLLVEVEPCSDVLCVDPGSTRTIAPTAATLATPTAVVVERTLDAPRSLAATARAILSRFMSPSSAQLLEASCAELLTLL